MLKNLLIVTILFPLFAMLSSCGSDENNISREELNELQIQIAKLQAIEDIRVLFTDYGRSLDERDYERFTTLYAKDAIYIGGSQSQGPEAIANQLETVISANATGANLHTFTNDRIEVDIENGTATAISRGAFYVQDENGDPTPLIFATYHDVLILTEDGWKFQRREIVGDIPGPANESR